MAAPMDILDPEGGKGKNGSALSVNRSSTKISKNLRRPLTQPRPAPQVYKTEPGEFRSLVQQLTGTSPAAPTVLTPKPSNSRLQNIAPPPLRPVFSYPSMQHPQQQNTQSGFNPGPPRMHSLPPLAFNQFTPQRPSNFSVSPLSFSPLPALSPGDHVWANVMNPLESPRSAAMRQLMQSMAEGGDEGEIKQESHSLSAMLPPQNTDFHTSNFHLPPRFGGPLSPRFSPQYNLSSPGMAPGFGFGNAYGHSSQFSPTAALAMDTSFSFPEPDISSSAYS